MAPHLGPYRAHWDFGAAGLERSSGSEGEIYAAPKILQMLKLSSSLRKTQTWDLFLPSLSCRVWTIDGQTGHKFPPAALPGCLVLSYWHDKGADGTPAPHLLAAGTWLGLTCLQLECPANGATESKAAEALGAGCRAGLWQAGSQIALLGCFGGGLLSVQTVWQRQRLFS